MPAGPSGIAGAISCQRRRSDAVRRCCLCRDVAGDTVANATRLGGAKPSSARHARTALYKVPSHQAESATCVTAPLRHTQNSPIISPWALIPIFSAAGTFGKPGMVIISPQTATTKPAPADNRTSRIGTICPVGAPSAAGSVEKLYCVFAMQTGRWPYPAFSQSASWRSTLGSATAAAAR